MSARRVRNAGLFKAEGPAFVSITSGQYYLGPLLLKPSGYITWPLGEMSQHIARFLFNPLRPEILMTPKLWE